MNEQELDHAYTTLCNALAEVGEPHAQRLLAMVCLGLMARQADPAEVLALISRAKEQCLSADPRDGGPQ